MNDTQITNQGRFLWSLVYYEFVNIWFYLYISPLAILAGLLCEFRIKVYNTPRVLQPPYSPWIRAGTNTPFIPVCISVWADLISIPRFISYLDTYDFVWKVGIALGWFLFTWIPHHWYWRTKRPWWFIVAVAKSIIAATFIPPIYFESRYLPRPLNSCQNDELWQDSGNVPYGSPSMFLLIQGSYGALGDPQKYVSSCEKLLSLWRFQIAMRYVSEYFFA
jgi:hypothetical protein